MLLSLVVCAEVERQARKEAGLEHADEETRRKKASVVGYEGGADDGSGPGENEEWNEAGWAGFLEDQRGGDFEGDIGH